MSKPTRAPRRKHPDYGPFLSAILNGGPLPDRIGNFEAARVLHPDSPGLLWGQHETFVEIWTEYHDTTMTDDDRARVATRVNEAMKA